ncbi:MAG: TolB family protein, partial [Gaiellaceae bacterium]
MAAPAADAAGRRLELVDARTGAVRVPADSWLGWEAPRAALDGRTVLVFRPDRGGFRVRRAIDLVSGAQTPLPVTHESAGSFSPDGTRVFAPRVPAVRGETTLETIGGRVVARLRPRVDDRPMSETWSPDGRFLAVTDQQDDTRSRFRVRAPRRADRPRPGRADNPRRRSLPRP